MFGAAWKTSLSSHIVACALPEVAQLFIHAVLLAQCAKLAPDTTMDAENLLPSSVNSFENYVK
jgi:hypothetical protein